MTSNNAPAFLRRLAVPLQVEPAQSLRYDVERAVSQVRIDETWVDAVDGTVYVGEGTFHTDVRQETTDDD